MGLTASRRRQRLAIAKKQAEEASKEVQAQPKEEIQEVEQVQEVKEEAHEEVQAQPKGKKKKE